MGGPERLAKHHGKGKLDARARLEHLLDTGTFREFGTLVGGEIAADGIVAGSGLIDGSPVMIGAEDFTTLAGSIGPGGNAKRYRLAELALRDRIPLAMLLEGAGFRPSGEHYGRTPTDLPKIEIFERLLPARLVRHALFLSFQGDRRTGMFTLTILNCLL
jgi:acetyl-CoA carboxylase carboxyltransferase component